MGRAKKPRLKSKVHIKEPVGYIQEMYVDKIAKVIQIRDELNMLIEFENGIRIVINKENLKVV